MEPMHTQSCGILDRHPHVVLAYKNFSHASHHGLGVSAVNTLKHLLAAGIPAVAWSLSSATQMIADLHKHPEVTHVIVSAPWLSTQDWFSILSKFPWVQFVVDCHSNVGFLGVDPNAMRLIIEGLDLSLGSPNFHIAANCTFLQRWLHDTYARSVVLLPNLYWLDSTIRLHRPLYSHGGVLRIGSFGATRPLKNHMTAAAAALEIASRLKVDMEFWMNNGRADGGDQTAIRTITQMFARANHCSVRFAPWSSWPAFRSTVAQMHLMMQPSYTESFNMVTADGIAEGVPSVVSTAIEWVPDAWQADADDVFDIAQRGRNLLRDEHAAVEGYEALVAYNDSSLRSWKKFLKVG